jgi:hypothetical protein
MRTFQAVGGGKKLVVNNKSSFDFLSCISSFPLSSYITGIVNVVRRYSLHACMRTFQAVGRSPYLLSEAKEGGV